MQLAAYGFERLHLEYCGDKTFWVWVSNEQFSGPMVRVEGKAFRALVDDRAGFTVYPISFGRDGRNITIDFNGEPWGDMRSESFRDFVQRAIRIAARKA